jgi:hypothetical protein
VRPGTCIENWFGLGYSSIINRSNSTFDVFPTSNCSGGRIALIYPGTANDDLGATGTRIRAVKIR